MALQWCSQENDILNTKRMKQGDGSAMKQAEPSPLFRSEPSPCFIGVLGGTFDPIHNGHLAIAQAALDKFSLSKVIFMPTGTPPHKTSIAKADIRLEMTTMATSSNPYFEVSRLELDRSGPSYTVDTLAELLDIYGNTIKIYYILGGDILFDLSKWKDFQKIFSMCAIMAVARPGINHKKLESQIKTLSKNYGAKIHLLNSPPIEVSSTMVRKAISLGHSVKGLVPESVTDYIKKNNLYK